MVRATSRPSPPNPIPSYIQVQVLRAAFVGRCPSAGGILSPHFSPHAPRIRDFLITSNIIMFSCVFLMHITHTPSSPSSLTPSHLHTTLPPPPPTCTRPHNPLRHSHHLLTHPSLILDLAIGTPWPLARLPTPIPPTSPYPTRTHTSQPTHNNSPDPPTSLSPHHKPHNPHTTYSPRPGHWHSHNPPPFDPLCGMVPALMGCPQWASAEMACTKRSQHQHSMPPEARPSGSQYMQEMSINAINAQTECKESHPQIIHPNTSPCRGTLSPQLTPPQSTPPSTSHPPPFPAFHSRCFSPYTLEFVPCNGVTSTKLLLYYVRYFVPCNEVTFSNPPPRSPAPCPAALAPIPWNSSHATELLLPSLTCLLCTSYFVPCNRRLTC